MKSVVRRRALLVATGAYEDPKLPPLAGPVEDVRRLGRVLANPDIGAFEVETVLDRGVKEVQIRLHAFLTKEDAFDETLLIHLSCHGLKDDNGKLYFAAADTEFDSLSPTGISAEWLNQTMAESSSKRIILVLDCCFAGVFAKKMTHKAAADSVVGIGENFADKGRVVLAASTATQYAYEAGERGGEPEPSVFTSAIIDGLESGDADEHSTGVVTVDGVYKYAAHRIAAAGVKQTPTKAGYVEGPDLVVAWSGKEPPIEVPAGIRKATESDSSYERRGAVEALIRLLDKHGVEVLSDRAVAVKALLVDLAENDNSDLVKEAARAALLASPGDSVAEPTSRPPQSPTPSSDGTTTPGDRRTGRWRWGVALAVMIVGAIAVVLLGTRVVVDVPDVRALPASSAATLLAERDLAGVPTSAPSTAAPDVVIAQEPGPGLQLLLDRSVDYVISSGPPPVSVPRLIALAEADAVTTLDVAGLVAGERSEATSEVIPGGAVVSQDPLEGDTMPPGSSVDYVVSIGRRRTAIPDFTGMPLEGAQAAAEESGLNLVSDFFETEEVAAGTVLDMEPDAGQEVVMGSDVTVTVAAAPSYVYWVNDKNDTLGRAKRDGTKRRPKFIEHRDIGRGVAMHGDRIYLGGGSSIDSWNVDGSGRKRLLRLDCSPIPCSPRIAANDRYIYWTERSSIGRANIDGTDVRNEFTALGFDPGDIAVDEDYIYWTDFDRGSIGRANIDGTEAKADLISTVEEQSFSGIAVDARYIYWTDDEYELIGRANLDGSDVDGAFISSVSTAGAAIAVDDRYIYWSDGKGAIGRADLDGSDVRQDLITMNLGLSGRTLSVGVPIAVGPSP